MKSTIREGTCVHATTHDGSMRLGDHGEDVSSVLVPFTGTVTLEN